MANAARNGVTRAPRARLRAAGLARVFTVSAIALLLAAPPPAYAADVPIKLLLADGTTIQGTVQLEGRNLSGSVELGNAVIAVNGRIHLGQLTISLNGPLTLSAAGKHAQCTAQGVSPSTPGDMTIPMTGSCGSDTTSLELSLVMPNAPAATTASPQPAQEATSLPPLDPIDDTYVATGPAQVRKDPDAQAATVKAIDAGQKVNVVGKLKGRDWYLVSDNDQPIGYVMASQLVPEAQYKPPGATAAVSAPAPAPAATPPPAPAPVPSPYANLDFGHYEALVIGNDKYGNGLPALKTAAADAQAVAQTLRTIYGFKVTVLLNATRDQIIGTLAKYREILTDQDNLLIYYAGHGSYDQAADQGYWLPIDAATDDPSRWVSNTDITNMLKAIQARHVLVVADSCYSGTLTRGAEVEIQGADYIQRMVEKKARTVMTSGGLEPVADSGSGGHSVFATAFIAALEQNNGVMDAQSFFAKVREPVVLAAPQTPEYSNLRLAGHEGGDFVFVRKQ